MCLSSKNSPYPLFLEKKYINFSMNYRVVLVTGIVYSLICMVRTSQIGYSPPPVQFLNYMKNLSKPHAVLRIFALKDKDFSWSLLSNLYTSQHYFNDFFPSFTNSTSWHRILDSSAWTTLQYRRQLAFRPSLVDRRLQSICRTVCLPNSAMFSNI